MESQCGCGCGFLNALRSAFAAIRKQVRKRRVRQRQRNLRVSPMEAMDTIEKEEDKKPNETADTPLKTSARGCSRAQLYVSGWRPKGHETLAEMRRRTNQDRIRAANRAFMEARLPTTRIKITTVVFAEEVPEDTTGQDDETIEVLNTDQVSTTLNADGVLHELVEEIKDPHGEEEISPLAKAMEITARRLLHGKKAHQENWQTLVLDY
ncbi:uncharacterized protein LOC134435517 [Engraulis encrasicolus]|uniref:uncharacterized protein LOC134435517 n=1 Tax=Engraulis encrasicolus TaxID=184585 RepID=UPI002FD3F6EE